MVQTRQTGLPPAVAQVISRLNQAGYQGYAVGGSVRDLLLGRRPKDWDVTTNARPPQIQQVFPRSLYHNRFGTVAVKQSRDVIEVTTYRFDGQYSDARHPDQVEFTTNLRDDLARRDFTINAMA